MRAQQSFAARPILHDSPPRPHTSRYITAGIFFSFFTHAAQTREYERFRREPFGRLGRDNTLSSIRIIIFCNAYIVSPAPPRRGANRKHIIRDFRCNKLSTYYLIKINYQQRLIINKHDIVHYATPPHTVVTLTHLF